MEDKKVTTSQAAERDSRELKDAELEKVSGGKLADPPQPDAVDAF